MAAADSKVVSVIVNVDATSATATVNFDDGTNQVLTPVASTTPPSTVTLPAGTSITVTAA